MNADQMQGRAGYEVNSCTTELSIAAYGKMI